MVLQRDRLITGAAGNLRPDIKRIAESTARLSRSKEDEACEELRAQTGQHFVDLIESTFPTAGRWVIRLRM
jgi:hypothetical protein